MAVVLLILDGLGDRPQVILGTKTPLQVAGTPNLDQLATLGSNGLLDPLGPGIPMGSERAHFLIFGYPLEDFPGRAVIEAMGRGVPMNPGDVLCLASFTWVVPDGRRLIRTPSSGNMLHTGDSIPILFVGMNVLQDDVAHFNERGAARGGMGHLRGLGIMNMALNFTDKANLYGVKHSPFPILSVPPEPIPLETTSDP